MKYILFYIALLLFPLCANASENYMCGVVVNKDNQTVVSGVEIEIWEYSCGNEQIIKTTTSSENGCISVCVPTNKELFVTPVDDKYEFLPASRVVVVEPCGEGEK